MQVYVFAGWLLPKTTSGTAPTTHRLDTCCKCHKLPPAFDFANCVARARVVPRQPRLTCCEMDVGTRAGNQVLHGAGSARIYPLPPEWKIRPVGDASNRQALTSCARTRVVWTHLCVGWTHTRGVWTRTRGVWTPCSPDPLPSNRECKAARLVAVLERTVCKSEFYFFRTN
jgi:hypothetical protein